ncbi:MAG: mechanosensitive ion channel [Lysobacterales bacterium]|jgi:potassium efflux system protein
MVQIGLGIILLAQFTIGLGQTGPAVPESSAALPAIADIEQKISALENTDPPEDGADAQVLALYQQALAAWQRVEKQLEQLTEHDALIASGRQRIEETLQRAAAVDAEIETPFDIPSEGDSQTFLPLLEQARADTATLRSQLNDLNRQVSTQDVRPRAIREELARENALLSTLDNELTVLETDASLSPALRDATRVSIKARQAAAQAAVTALEKEILTQPIRAEMLQAQKRELESRIRRSGARVEALEALLAAAQRAEALVAIADAGVEVPPELENDPLVIRLRQANVETAQLITQLTGWVEETRAVRGRVLAESKRIEDSFNLAQRQLELVSSTQQFGQILQQEWRSLPDMSDYRARVAERETRIREASLRLLQLERERSQLEESAADAAASVGLSKAADPAIRETINELVQARIRLLQQALRINENYLQNLSELAFDEEGLYRITKEFDTFLAKRLLWLRTRGGLDFAALEQLADEIRSVADSEWWIQAGVDATLAIWHPLGLLCTIALFWLLIKRRGLLRALRQTAEGVGKPSVDTFRQTLRALGITIALSLPLPLFIALVGHWMTGLPVSDSGVVALGTGLVTVAPLLFFVALLRTLCQPHGLGVAHFRWNERAVHRLRHQLDILLLTFVLPSFLLVLTVTRTATLSYGEITRALLIVLTCGLGLFLYQLLKPKSGILVTLKPSSKVQERNRRSWIGFGISMLIPAALLIAVIYGYVYSAGELLSGLINTLWLLVGLAILQELIHRGLLVARRRLELRQILARREAQELAEHAADEFEVARLVLDDEVDVHALDSDTRKIVRVGIILTGAIGVLLIWSDTLPALSVLRDIVLWHTAEGETLQVMSLADLLLALLVAFLTFVGARNLPSVVEIMLRQRADVEPGTRVAVATLIRYAIVFVGTFVALDMLGASWSKLQWLVAAVGVGIGFGLQEIVANFISGLIILIERPVRVGDVVTVGDASGVVTRVQIRATTVRTWDRQELLVPNKEFITGRVMNWSLTDDILRIHFLVGIAYGSDVEQALALMEEAAQEHPVVLDEPAPFMTFESFGDNALNLGLRCFVPSLDVRLQTVTDLHRAINRKFSEAGIVIAYPQRDVHIDTTSPLEVRVLQGSESPKTAG